MGGGTAGSEHWVRELSHEGEGVVGVGSKHWGDVRLLVVGRPAGSQDPCWG